MLARTSNGLALSVALLALAIGLSACGGDGGDGGDERPTPANDEEAFLQVLQDYGEFRADGDATKLAPLFSAGFCSNRELEAQQIISKWDLVSEEFSIRVDGVTVESLTGDVAMVVPVGELIQNDEPSGPLASQPIEMRKEEGAWKIASCGLVLPNVDFTLP